MEKSRTVQHFNQGPKRGSQSAPHGMREPLPRTGDAEGGPLPCLYRNNCIERVPPYQRKQAETLAQNVKHMAEKVGIERVGFLTLTFPKRIQDRKEAQRRWHSLWTNALCDRYGESIKVFERHKNGGIHFHLLVEVSADIRTGFDFEAFGACQAEYGKHGKSPAYRRLHGEYVGKASEALKAEWAWLRGTMKKYGFGRHELLPIRSTSEGIGRYVGKYLSKGRAADTEGRDKGVRRIEYLQGARRQSLQWSWVTPGAWVWRHKLGVWMAKRGFKSFEEVRAECGPKWAWNHRLQIEETELPEDTVWPTIAHMEAAGLREDGLSIRHMANDVGMSQENVVNIRGGESDRSIRQRRIQKLRAAAEQLPPSPETEKSIAQAREHMQKTGEGFALPLRLQKDHWRNLVPQSLQCDQVQDLIDAFGGKLSGCEVGT